MIPWDLIITGLVSIFCTSGVFIFLVNPKAAKKKPEIENKSADADANKTIMETAKELMVALKEDRADADARYDSLESKYDAKVKELDDTNSALAVCGMLLCKHSACPLRDPNYGQGKDWLNKNLNGEVSIDSSSIEDIAESKGYAIKRIKKLSTTE